MRPNEPKINKLNLFKNGGEKMPKKKTKEEYVDELVTKAPHIELVGDYINARTKTMHHCVIHDIFWETTPDAVLRGRWCRECGEERYSIKRKKPQEQYIEELKIKNPTVMLLEDYMDSHTPTKHYCTEHHITFDIRPYDALKGKGCKYCRSDKIKNALMKTADEYVEELSYKNPTTQLVGEYKGTDTPTEHYCSIHNIVWDARPSNILHGKGCQQCKSEKIANGLRKSESEYVIELSSKNPNIELRGTYVNSITPVEHYCNKHDVFFNITPISALKGCGCRQCSAEKLRAALLKTREEYLCELKEANPSILLVGEYVGANINTLHKCLVCGCEWSVRPNNVLHGCGCPSCNQSKGEQKVKLWLEQNSISFTPQKKFEDCCDKRPLPFDFYLDSFNICIEYQGIQHYESVDAFGGTESLEYTQYHDKIKKDYCELNDILLICIPYWEDVNEYLNQNLLI